VGFKIILEFGWILRFFLQRVDIKRMKGKIKTESYFRNEEGVESARSGGGK